MPPGHLLPHPARHGRVVGGNEDSLGSVACQLVRCDGRRRSGELTINHRPDCAKMHGKGKTGPVEVQRPLVAAVPDSDVNPAGRGNVRKEVREGEGRERAGGEEGMRERKREGGEERRRGEEWRGNRKTLKGR